MLFAFLACLTWAPAIWGFGSLLAPRDLRELRPAVAGLLGFLVLAALALGVNLVAPVSPAVAAGAWAIGTALFAYRGRSVLHGQRAVTLVVMLGALLALCALVRLPGRHYDMGLYYLQAVKWAQEHRQPLGLATMHARLGFNSSWFAVAALLEHPLAVGRSAFIANTLVVWFGAWAAWAGVLRVRAGDTSPWALLLAGAALPVAAAADGVGGQGADYPAAVLVYLSIASWVAALDPEGRFELHGGVGWLLAALALTVKVSTAPVLAAAAVILLLRRRSISRAMWPGLAIGAALLVVWMARGYMASGCPLYPSQVACVPSLPWATPARIAIHEVSWIKSWARLPGVPPDVVLASWDWIGPWTRTATKDTILRAVAFLLAAAVVAQALRPRPPSRHVLAGWAIAIAGVLMWFFSAPTPRFALGFLFAAALVPLAGAAAIQAAAGARAGRVALAIGAAAVCVAIVEPSLAWTRHARRARAPWVGWPEMPRAATNVVQTASGLRVHVPLAGDQCWSAPLPCTPYFDPGLTYEDGMFRTSTGAPKP